VSAVRQVGIRPGAAWLLAGALGLCAGGCGEDPSGDAAGADGAADERPTAERANDGAAEPGPAPERARGVRLLARREVELAGKPVGLLARDVDGDGTADAIVATRAPGTLQVLRGGRAGLEPDGAPAPLGGDLPLAPVAVGGGFAIGLQDARAVLWFSAADAAPARVALGAAPRAVGPGEEHGDGRAELLVACADDTLAVIALDGGEATLVRTLALPVELHGRPTFVRRVAGRIALGAQLAEALFVLDRDARSVTRRVELGGIPRDCVESDLDGDGDLELVIAGGDRSVWALGLGAPGGHAAWIDDADAAPRDVGAARPGGAVPVDVERVDLDRDGRDELVLIDFYDSGYGVLGAFGADGAPALTQREYAGQDPVAGALADFDGDGHADLAIANRNARRVSLVLGTGTATPRRPAFHQSLRVPTPANPSRVRAANLDDDPLPEPVVICAGDRVVVARRNRFGLIEADGPVIARDSGARALFAGVRRAGGPASVALLEAGGASEHGARIVALEARGDGFAPAGAASAGVEARDLVGLRGPGGITLVAVDPAGGALHLIAPDPNAATARRVPVGAPPLAACALDRDGDGADELAVATGAELLVGPADGALAPAGPLALPGHAPAAMRAADVDGDGRQDLVVLYTGGRDTAPGRVAVLLARGDGFQRAALVETGLAPAAIAAGDVDGDGRAEIFCAAQNSHNVNVWTPTGPPEALLHRLPDVGAGLGPLDVHLVDLDGDGWLDLVTANNFSFDLSVAYNLSDR
jgi:hypothetical protein